MRSPAKKIAQLAACGAACAIVTGFPVSASANDWLTLGKEGWIPSVAAFGGATIQKQKATVASSCANGGAGFMNPPGENDPEFASCIGLPQPGDAVFVPGPAELRPSASGNDWAVSPTLGFDLQLLTPSLDAIPGRPRLFVRGEIQLTFGSIRDVANEGDPTGANIGELVNAPEDIPTGALSGTGSRTISEIQTLGFGAVAGIAFPFEFLGHRLWVKPGAAWTRYSIDIVGVVEAGLKNDPPTTAIIPQWGGQLRVISLRSKKSPTYNGIGPSLELEMDVGQFGPLGASLFVGGAVYRILGDRSTSFSSSLSFPATAPSSPPSPARGLPADTYTANSTFKVDPWLTRGAVGFRLHWYGF